MAKIPFTYYLHDDATSFERYDDLHAQDERFTEELVEHMGRPFYEVTLYCQADTETGEVTILKAE